MRLHRKFNKSVKDADRTNSLVSPKEIDRNTESGPRPTISTTCSQNGKSSSKLSLSDSNLHDFSNKLHSEVLKSTADTPSGSKVFQTSGVGGSLKKEKPDFYAECRD